MSMLGREEGIWTSIKVEGDLHYSILLQTNFSLLVPF